MGKDKSRLLRIVKYKKGVEFNDLKRKYNILQLEKELNEEFKNGNLKILKKIPNLEIYNSDFNNSRGGALLTDVYKNMKNVGLGLSDKISKELDQKYTVYYKDGKISRGNISIKINPPEKRIKEIKFSIEEFMKELKEVTKADKNRKYLATQSLNNINYYLERIKNNPNFKPTTPQALIVYEMINGDISKALKRICNSYSCNNDFLDPLRAALFNVFLKKNINHALDIFLNLFTFMSESSRHKLENIIVWHLFGNKNYSIDLDYDCFRFYYDNSFLSWLDTIYKCGNFDGFSCECKFNY